MDHGRSEGSESPKVRKSESPEVGKSGSREVRKSGSREVRSSGSRDFRKSERPEDKNYSYALHVLFKKLGHPERRERNYTPCFTANACTLSQGMVKMDAFVMLIASASMRTGPLIRKKKDGHKSRPSFLLSSQNPLGHELFRTCGMNYEPTATATHHS